MNGISDKLLIELFRIPYRQKKINKRLGLNFKLDVKGIFEPIEEVNICCILMELQPKADNLIHRFKFPGL